MYLVFDARAANGYTEEAVVMESFDAPSDSKAKQQAYRMWGDRAYVLYGSTLGDDGVYVEDEAPLKKHWC